MEGGGAHGLKQTGVRLVLGAQAALFFDDFEFFAKVLVAPLVIGKAVRFQCHDLTQAGDRDLLVVTGVVSIGERVFAASQGGHPA